MENRLVAFIDILGFRNTIKELDDSKAEDLFKTLKAVKNVEPRSTVVKMLGDNVVAEFNPDIKFLAVSDCIVVSAEDSWAGAFQLFMILFKASRALLVDGYLIKAGIDYGPMFHKENVFFGLAYQNAYLLEIEQAIYPRALLSIAAHERIKELEKNNNPGVTFNLTNYLWDDDDGHSVNYLRQFNGIIPKWHPTEDPDQSTMMHSDRYLNIGHTLISKGLREHTDEKTIRKYKWLQRKWNLTVDDDFHISDE